MSNETGSLWIQPESAFNEEKQPEYPYNHVTQTRSGHTMEFDDTPGRERIRIAHRMESFIEIQPDGSVVHKIVGDGFEITAKDKNIKVEGQYNLEVLGDAVINIQGNAQQYVKGDYSLYVEGDYTLSVKGDAEIQSDSDLSISANPIFGGSINMNTGGTLILDCDLTVSGQIIAEKISASTRIDAGTGVYAGPLGFVTPLGGVSVGMAFAIPGTIYSSAVITTPGLVSGSLGTFKVMCANLMTDTVNTTLYNTHTHPAPKGRTGPPQCKMV